MAKPQTIYAFAHEQMSGIVLSLLDLANSTQNFTHPPQSAWTNASETEMLLCGKGIHIEDIKELQSPENAWLGRLAIPFSLELAATGILYKKLRVFTDSLIGSAFAETKNFSEVTPEWVFANPRFLPVLMHVMGTFSKQ